MKSMGVKPMAPMKPLQTHSFLNLHPAIHGGCSKPRHDNEHTSAQEYMPHRMSEAWEFVHDRSARAGRVMAIRQLQQQHAGALPVWKQGCTGV